MSSFFGYFLGNAKKYLPSAQDKKKKVYTMLFAFTMLNRPPQAHRSWSGMRGAAVKTRWLVGPESEFPLRFNTIRGKTRRDCAFAIAMRPGNTKPRESWGGVFSFEIKEDRIRFYSGFTKSEE